MKQKTSQLLSPHRYIGYTLNSAWPLHNDLGYRGENFTLAKDAGETRIVVMGDSIIYQDEGKLSIPEALDELVDSKVINGGVGGYSMLEVMLSFLLRVLDIGPDAVVIYPCIDDVRSRLTTYYRADNSGRRVSNTYQSDLKNWTLKGAIRSLFHAVGIRRYQIVSVASPHYEPKNYALLEANPPVYFQRNIEHIIHIARHRAIRVVLCTMSYYREIVDKNLLHAFAEHNEVVRRIAQAEKTDLCDLERLNFERECYRADGCHYTDVGVRLVANELRKFFVAG
jgi:lysophospholipase L1-like esterase